MSVIYMHIPFWSKACHYCSSHFSTSLVQKNDLLHALLKEIELAGNNWEANEPVETLYFGGGTPSLLQKEELESIIIELNKRFTIKKNAEITLEANPDDINAEIVRGWKEIGIN